MVKNLPVVQETRVPSPGQEDPLETGMASHSSILAWRIPWAEEPGGLQSMGPQRSGTRLRDQLFHFLRYFKLSTQYSYIQVYNDLLVAYEMNWTLKIKHSQMWVFPYNCAQNYR